VNELRGGCHCGNVDFTLVTDWELDGFVPRRCSCSMCRKHGASYISDPEARLALRYRDGAKLSLYRLGHGTSQWVICSRCGVLVSVLCEIEGRLRAVVRVQSIDGHSFSRSEVATNFETESVEERLQRRARTWIGTVTVSPPLAPMKPETADFSGRGEQTITATKGHRSAGRGNDHSSYLIDKSQRSSRPRKCSMNTRVFGADLVAPIEMGADRLRTLTTEGGAHYGRPTSKDCRLLGVAAFVAMFVFSIASAYVNGTRSLSAALAGPGDPFIAGYTEEHPAVPGPYAELPMRHYLAAHDPMIGVNLTAREPPAHGVAQPPLAAISMLPP